MSAIVSHHTVSPAVNTRSAAHCLGFATLRPIVCPTCHFFQVSRSPTYTKMSSLYPSGCPLVLYLHHGSFALKRNIRDIFILLDSGHFNQLRQKFFSGHKFILEKRNPLHGDSCMTPKYCIKLMRGYLITLRSLKNDFDFRGLSIIQNT